MSLDKQTFIKLQPRRFIPNDKITSLGSNQYQTSFVPKEAVAVYRANGTLDPTPLTFTWDAQTGTVTYTSTTAPNDDIFIDYALYFCTTRYFYVYDNPVDGTGNEKEWEPRLNSHQSFGQDISDQLAGVVSTSSSTFRLLNNDGGLYQYVTKFDNFKNQKAFAYCKIGDDYKNLYRGVISKITVGDNITVVLKAPNKLFDYDNTLKNDRRYQTYNETDYPNVDKRYKNKPVPISYGPQPVHPTPIEVFSGIFRLRYAYDDIAQFTEMVYLGFGFFGCGVIDDPWSILNPESLPVTFVRVDPSSFQATTYVYSIPAPYAKFFIRDQNVRWYDGNGNFRDTSTFDIREIDYENNLIWSLISPQDVTRIVIESLFIVETPNNDTGILEESRVYDPNPGQPTAKYPIFELLHSGQYFVKWYFEGLSGFAELEGAKKYGCVLISKSISQTEYVKKLVESTGEQIEPASLTLAQSQANTDVMKILNNRSDVQNILDSIQDIVSVNNGLLFFDNKINKYKYKIMNQNVSGLDWQVNDSDILEPNLIPKIDYSDSFSTILLKHTNQREGTEYLPNSDAERDSSFSLTFNNESKTQTILHNLEAVNTIADQKIELLTGYNTFYEFSLASDFYFDINVGDIIRINNLEDKILNNETFIDVIVLSVKKSAETLRLKTYDYKKIP